MSTREQRAQEFTRSQGIAYKKCWTGATVYGIYEEVTLLFVYAR